MTRRQAGRANPGPPRALPLLVGRLPAGVVRVVPLVLLLVLVRPLARPLSGSSLVLFGLGRVLVPLLLPAPVLLVGHDSPPRYWEPVRDGRGEKLQPGCRAPPRGPLRGPLRSDAG